MIAALIVTAGLIVVDGDTVKDADTGERYRIEDIDAPEKGWRASCEAERALADRATAAMAEYLKENARPVFTGRTGGRGRPLILLRTGDQEDSVSDLLIARGLAVPWDGRRHAWCAHLNRPR